MKYSALLLVALVALARGEDAAGDDDCDAECQCSTAGWTLLFANSYSEDVYGSLSCLDADGVEIGTGEASAFGPDPTYTDADGVEQPTCPEATRSVVITYNCWATTHIWPLEDGSPIDSTGVGPNSCDDTTCTEAFDNYDEACGGTSWGNAQELWCTDASTTTALSAMTAIVALVAAAL